MGSPSKKKNCKVTADCLLQIAFLLHPACLLQVLDRVKDKTKLWSILKDLSRLRWLEKVNIAMKSRFEAFLRICTLTLVKKVVPCPTTGRHVFLGSLKCRNHHFDIDCFSKEVNMHHSMPYNGQTCTKNNKSTFACPWNRPLNFASLNRLMSCKFRGRRLYPKVI